MLARLHFERIGRRGAATLSQFGASASAGSRLRFSTYQATRSLATHASSPRGFAVAAAAAACGIIGGSLAITASTAVEAEAATETPAPVQPTAIPTCVHKEENSAGHSPESLFAEMPTQSLRAQLPITSALRWATPTCRTLRMGRSTSGQRKRSRDGRLYRAAHVHAC